MHGPAGIKSINDWAASDACKRIVGAAPSEAKYEGHLPNGHGVQAHSAGPLFPFIHYQKAVDGVALADYIMVGTVTVRVPSYAMAEQLVAEARHIKANAVAFSATVQPLDECLASAARLHGYAVERFREEA